VRISSGDWGVDAEFAAAESSPNGSHGGRLDPPQAVRMVIEKITGAVSRLFLWFAMIWFLDQDL
jgi:hypothetical protein